MKKFKKICCFAIGIMLSLMFLDVVYAADSCQVYKNYYYFVDIKDYNGFKSLVADGETLDQTNRTYLIKLLNNSNEKINVIKNEQLCLKRDDNDDASCESYKNLETWTLQKFYDYFLKTQKSNVTQTFEADSNSITSYIYQEGNNKYIIHGFNQVIENGQVIPGGPGVDLTGISVDSLIKASALPYSLDISIADNTDIINNHIKTDINRKITTKKYNTDLVPFDVVWVEGEGEVSSVVSPALYSIEYEVCLEGTPEPNNPETGGMFIGGMIIASLICLCFAIYYSRYRVSNEI